MDNMDRQEMTRRQFLTWLAGAAALAALPVGGSIANAAAPSWAFANLDLPDVMPADMIIDFPDPPPPIVNPPGVSTPPAAPAAAQASAAPYSHNAYAQYGAYSPQLRQGYQAVPTVYQTPQTTSTAASAAYQPPAAQQAAYRQMKLSATRRTAPAPTTPTAPAVRSVPAPGGKVSAISRRMWANVPAYPDKMRPMGKVMRITIHHEGSEKANNDVLPFDVVETLRLIHSQHRKRMGAGDIGYHFIIDRSGSIWQGRDWAYQGAHTSGANQNNLGVMLLGNFEFQRPTQQQLDSMTRLVASLMRKYGLNPANSIYGHNDFCKTHCPGSNLKPYLESLRRMSV